MELRGEAAERYIFHNVNRNKWWHDGGGKQEKEYKMANTQLTKYILKNINETVGMILKFREKNDDIRAMNKSNE
jgi:hypothetical protein